MRKVYRSKIIIDIATALFFTSIFVLCFYITVDDKIDQTISLVNIFAAKTADYKETEIVYNFDKRKLVDYPYYGEKFAKIKIPAMKLELPLYHGDTLKILRKGVGHHGGSYYPGENGTILLAAHNTSKFFKNLDVLKKSDEIVIEAKYGTFKYIVDSSKVVKETDIEAFEIKQDGEKLIMYTCYPMHQSVVGRRTKRYVVYAYREGDTNE